MNFSKVADGLDVKPLVTQLAAHPEIWDTFRYRTATPGTPHAEVNDIWVYYRDLTPFKASGEYSKMHGVAEQIWQPEAAMIPAVKDIAFSLMAAFRGERLGTILITRLPPGGKIAPHIDRGWNADTTEKFFIPLANMPGSMFCWDDGGFYGKPGEVWWFRNDRKHWVVNNSDGDRLALIVTLKTEMFAGLKDDPA